MKIYQKFIPTIYSRTIFDIDYNKLKDEGITTLFFDLDNTIIPNDVILIDDKSLELLNKLKEDFKVLILSNNREERVKNAVFDLDYIYLAEKPLLRWVKKALKRTNSKASTTALIGDQLFTDILAAHRAKIKEKILVHPIKIWADAKTTTFNRKISNYFIKKIKKRDPNSYNLYLKDYCDDNE